MTCTIVARTCPEASRAAEPRFEDLLDCPFRELGLLESVPNLAHTWRFTRGMRLPVPPSIVGYACVDHLHRQDTDSMTLARLAHEAGSPGLALRLPEPALAAALEEVATADPGLHLPDAASGRRLVLSAAPDIVRDRIVETYYRRGDAAALKVGEPA